MDMFLRTHTCSCTHTYVDAHTHPTHIHARSEHTQTGARMTSGSRTLGDITHRHDPRPAAGRSDRPGPAAVPARRGHTRSPAAARRRPPPPTGRPPAPPSPLPAAPPAPLPAAARPPGASVRRLRRRLAALRRKGGSERGGVAGGGGAGKALPEPPARVIKNPQTARGQNPARRRRRRPAWAAGWTRARDPGTRAAPPGPGPPWGLGGWLGGGDGRRRRGRE